MPIIAEKAEMIAPTSGKSGVRTTDLHARPNFYRDVTPLEGAKISPFQMHTKRATPPYGQMTWIVRKRREKSGYIELILKERGAHRVSLIRA